MGMYEVAVQRSEVWIYPVDSFQVGEDSRKQIDLF